MSDKKVLRQTFRAKRQELSSQQQHDASEKFAKHFLKSDLFSRCNTFACYLAFDGELDLTPVIEAIWKKKKHCYLPVIDNDLLLFSLYKEDTTLKENKYKIPEPQSKELVGLHELDAILLPLTAFDQHNNRLGMGAGFYDRTLVSVKSSMMKALTVMPTLIGVAHQCQAAEQLPVDSWDVPLDMVITDKGKV
jgi:5-formyltetrahydrofolate cyclo-ligase